LRDALNDTDLPALANSNSHQLVRKLCCLPSIFLPYAKCLSLLVFFFSLTLNSLADEPLEKAKAGQEPSNTTQEATEPSSEIEREGIAGMVDEQRIPEDEIRDKWTAYFDELKASRQLLRKNKQLLPTIRRRLLADIDKIHQAMLKEGDWQTLERQRQIVADLIQIRYKVSELAGDLSREAYGAYNADSIKAAKDDVALILMRFKVHMLWLLKTAFKSFTEMFTEPVAILDSVIAVLIYMALLFAFLRLSKNYFSHQSVPTGYFSALLFRLSSVLRRRVAYWVFVHYALSRIYKNYAWPEFELSLLVLNEIFFWYVMSALALYWISSQQSIKQLDNKLKARVVSLQRCLIIFLAIFSLKNKVGAYLFGEATILYWFDQWLVFLFAVYCFIELRRFNRMLLTMVAQKVRIAKKYEEVLSLTGLLKPLASIVAMGLLFYQSFENRVISYVRRNENARKFLAYWSRQEISRLSEHDDYEGQKLLSDNELSCFDVSYVPNHFVNYGDLQIAKLQGLISNEQQHFMALVGARGVGKTTLLKRFIEKSTGEVLLKYIQCPNKGEDVFAEIAEGLGVKDYQSPEQLLAVLKKYPKSCICLDDCQRLFVPSIGGLAVFEALVDLMRQAGGQVSWLMSFEAPSWQFFVRVRGERSVFDRVLELPKWNELQIQQLIDSRNKEAGLKPNFSKLFLPSEQSQEWLLEDASDENESLADGVNVDDDEALSLSDLKEQALRTRAQLKSYARVLWDFSSGSPQSTLWAWRHSLYKEENTGDVYVMLFKGMDQSELEKLPNLMMFVLKTILQMENATVEDICLATNLDETETSDAVRFLSGRFYIEIKNGRYCISETWLRPISVLLMRQHLLESA